MRRRNGAAKRCRNRGGFLDSLKTGSDGVEGTHNRSGDVLDIFRRGLSVHGGGFLLCVFGLFGFFDFRSCADNFADELCELIRGAEHLDQLFDRHDAGLSLGGWDSRAHCCGNRKQFIRHCF